MPFDTPRTWVAGETVTAAIMNDYVRDQQRESFNYQIIDTSGSVGDMAYAATTSGDLALLTIGSAGQLMRVNVTATGPEWATMEMVQSTAIYMAASTGASVNIDWAVGFSATPRVMICPQSTQLQDSRNPYFTVQSVTTSGVLINWWNQDGSTASWPLYFNAWGFST